MTNCRKHLVSCLESKHFLTELVLGKSNELVAIAYHDVKMRRLQSRFPELLLLDATYKLNDLRMPLYVLIVVDGNGESVVVGLWIVANEEWATISGLMDIFIRYNDTDSIKCVMADKDMVEWDVNSEKLPGCSTKDLLIPHSTHVPQGGNNNNN